MLGVPCYGGMAEQQFNISVMQALSQFGHCEIHSILGESLVPRARNTIAKVMLEKDFTHLMFLDCDLTFPPDAIAKLLSHDLPFVAGMYPKKKKTLDWCVNYIPGEKANEQGLLKIRYAGTGAIVVAREVFERMIETYGPQIEYVSDFDEGSKTMWDFFSVGVVNRRYLSEDWYFCNRWLEMGGEIFADVRAKFGHIGKITYPLDSYFLDWGDIRGDFSDQELYRKAVEALPDDGTIIEVGAFMGKSTMFLADKIRHSGKKGRIIAIDDFHGRTESEKAQATNIGGNVYGYMLNHVRAAGMQHFVSALESDMKEAPSKVEDSSADCIILNGNYEESVWQSKLKPGGVILSGSLKK
jgi:hypothetical protein